MYTSVFPIRSKNTMDLFACRTILKNYETP